MAWNPSPKVADLRELSRKWGYAQIVVLAVNPREGTFETVSYGMTPELCGSAKRIMDQVHDKVTSGDIEIDS